MHDAGDALRAHWAIVTKAGTAYFTIVFGAGFLLGTLRVLVVAPKLGESVAVTLELLVMITLSWVACRRLTARLEVPKKWFACLSMGAYAFALLMLAEFGISTLMLGRSVSGQFGHYREFPALFGLAAQNLFAFFPLLQAVNQPSLEARVVTFTRW